VTPLDPATAAPSSHLVPFDGTFRVQNADPDPPRNAPSREECAERLQKAVEKLSDLQRLLYADNRYALLVMFQALDAAGKDSTIRAVFSGVDPAGCMVFSFKQPSQEELDHDFLWRTAVRLPERGRIGVFNRSYYEEVIVVRVHPEYLENQRLPGRPALDPLWYERFDSIRDHERHLARNGTVILKFWLNVSREKQRERFLERIEEPEKNWKFAPADVKERRFWNDYQFAYQEALRETSKPWAPWYAVPADSKPYMRMTVAEIIAETLEKLDLRYPKPDGDQRERQVQMRKLLDEEDRRQS
jgi:PPK2 family polyphosphate:nucleotide phosphotransferase